MAISIKKIGDIEYKYYHFDIKLNEDLYNELKELAKQNYVNIPSLIRYCIVEYLKLKKQGKLN